MGTFILIVIVIDLPFRTALKLSWEDLLYPFKQLICNQEPRYKRLERMGSLCLLLIILSTSITILFFSRQARSSGNRFQRKSGILVNPAVPFRFLDLFPTSVHREASTLDWAQLPSRLQEWFIARWCRESQEQARSNSNTKWTESNHSNSNSFYLQDNLSRSHKSLLPK